MLAPSVRTTVFVPVSYAAAPLMLQPAVCVPVKAERAVPQLLVLQVTPLVAVHVPLAHAAVSVHDLPSLQAAPSFPLGLEHTPVDGSQVPARWHASRAVQVTGLDPVHVPLWQESVWVQALPSLQEVPSFAFGFEHMPVDVSQVPATWHWSRAEQVTGLDPVHVPLWQESVWVQALPSLQAVPLVALGFEHMPVDVSQVPATWHWSRAVHVTGLAPVHVPLTHVSVWVQALPSLQEVPSFAFGFEHTPVDVSQVPATWQESDAVHTTGVFTQTPLALHASVVHGLPSLHSLALVQPASPASPESVVLVPSTAASVAASLAASSVAPSFASGSGAASVASGSKDASLASGSPGAAPSLASAGVASGSASGAGAPLSIVPSAVGLPSDGAVASSAPASVGMSERSNGTASSQPEATARLDATPIAANRCQKRGWVIISSRTPPRPRRQ
jgi:hypothetical protein